MNTVLHIGVGNFHRAHQAWYTACAPGDWSVLGVSLRRTDMRDALKTQGWKYTLAVKDQSSVDYHPVEVFRGILVAPEDPSAVLSAIADPTTHAVTITVTEKGYTLNAAAELDLEHSDIRHDLASDRPRSLVGFLARGLEQRAAAGVSSITVISCDNVSENGAVLHGAVQRFLSACGSALELDNIAAFPNSMVDRITPATTPALVAECNTATGFQDVVPVETEGFSEWVIEDCAVGVVPDWAASGAQWVSDVAPFELRKLRLLNGTHTLMAHLGRWRGHAYVHEAIADPVVRDAVDALMVEAVDTLPATARDGVEAYQTALIERYANPALNHALAQIAMDSSLKLGVRIMPVLNHRMTQGLASPACCAALAAWVAQTARDAKNGTLSDDPAHPIVEQVVAQSSDRAALVEGMLKAIVTDVDTAVLCAPVVSSWPV